MLEKLGARFRGACRPLTGRRFAKEEYDDEDLDEDDEDDEFPSPDGGEGLQTRVRGVCQQSWYDRVSVP